MRRPLHLVAAVVATSIIVMPVALAQKADQIVAQTVDEIVAKNLAAKGGIDLVRQTTSVKMTGTFRVLKPTEMTMPMTTWAKRPNLMRQESEVTLSALQVPPGMPPGPMKTVRASDGTSVWIQQGAIPPRALPKEQAKAMMEGNEFETVFVDYESKGITIELLGVPKLNGRDVYHLKVSKKDGVAQHYYLDASTGLESKVSTEVSQGGDTARVDTELSDYRKIDGRMVPFKTRQSVNGELQAEMTVETVEFNLPMPDSLFAMPAKQ